MSWVPALLPVGNTSDRGGTLRLRRPARWAGGGAFPSESPEQAGSLPS